MGEGLTQAPTPLSPERAENARLFLDMQLSLAEEMSKRKNITVAEAMFLYSSHGHLFIFASGDDTQLAKKQEAFSEAFNTCGTHQERRECILRFFGDEQRFEKKGESCFSYNYGPGRKVISIHFRDDDASGKGPLSAERYAKRREELTDMFREIKKKHPGAQQVEGASWLYDREAYRRLFPAAYGNSRLPVTEDWVFQGYASWGQFFDSDKGINRELRDEFLHNLKNIDRYIERDELYKLFPIRTYLVHAPISEFYKEYGIE